MSKVVVCGTATTSLHLANTFGDDWQIYSCNGAFNQLDRLDLHFELHDIDYLKNDVKPDPSYFQFLKDIGPKAVLNRKYEEFPQAQVYPLQDICDFIGANYFNNTIAYLIAYAMWANQSKAVKIYDENNTADDYNLKGLTDLSLIGVDMAGDGEYVSQRPCCEFYLGIAKGKGIELHIPAGCPLLNSSHLYGFEKLPAFVVSSKQQLEALKIHEKNMKSAKEVADENYYYARGMKEGLQTVIKRHQ